MAIGRLPKGLLQLGDGGVVGLADFFQDGCFALEDLSGPGLDLPAAPGAEEGVPFLKRLAARHGRLGVQVGGAVDSGFGVAFEVRGDLLEVGDRLLRVVSDGPRLAGTGLRRVRSWT